LTGGSTDGAAVLGEFCWTGMIGKVKVAWISATRNNPTNNALFIVSFLITIQFSIQHRKVSLNNQQKKINRYLFVFFNIERVYKFIV
jgi:hypothetical protein